MFLIFHLPNDLGSTVKPYTEKSVVVRGNPDYAEESPNQWKNWVVCKIRSLKGGPGWIFAKSKKAYVENYFVTGQYHPLTQLK